MNLHTSAGWRRLSATISIVFAPVAIATLGFALVNIQGFMHSTWALWALLASVLVPYSLAYVADMLRRREARDASDGSGDASPLVFAGLGNVEPAQTLPAHAAPKHGSMVLLLWVGLAAVTGYGLFRFWFAIANGSTFDWTLVVVLIVTVCAAVLIPGVVGWRRFERSASRIGKVTEAWPVFRTDQFAKALHRERPGATIPQDLLVSLSGTDINVWTTEREPRLLLSLPREAETAVSSVRISDRLGSTGIRLERHNGDELIAFDLIIRRRGIFTYFRTDQTDADRYVRRVNSGAQV